MLDCVADQIGEYLGETVAIPLAAQVAARLHLHRAVRVRSPHLGHHVGDYPPQVAIGPDDGNAVAETRPRKIEEVVDHLIHAPGAAGDPVDERQMRLVQLGGVQHESRRRDDCAERRAQVVSEDGEDRKSTRLNSSHLVISYAVFCLKKKKTRDICNDSYKSCSGSLSAAIIALA